MSEEEPKIFIDEGWKSQVQREKEEAARKAAEAQAAPAAAPTPVNPILGDGDEGEPLEGEEEASFVSLVGSLATQTMFALGLIADPGSGQLMVNLDAARYTLDMLAVIGEKTKGNLTEEEDEALRQTCGELEQAFAVRLQQFQQQAMQQAGIDPNNLKID